MLVLSINTTHTPIKLHQLPTCSFFSFHVNRQRQTDNTHTNRTKNNTLLVQFADMHGKDLVSTVLDN